MKIPFWFMIAALACAGCKKSDPAAKTGSGGSASEEESATVADDGSPVALKVKWPVGNRYTQRMEMKGDTKTPVAQQKVELNQEYTITVLRERTNGGRELELEFQATEMDVTVNGKPVVNLDTRAEAGGAEASNPVTAGFREIVGAKITLLMDASNNVEKVEGVQQFLAKASRSGNPQGRAAMQGIFSEQYFKQLVDFGRGFPQQPVKPGDSWPLQFDVEAPMLGTIKLDLNNTFKGWESRENRKCAAIDFNGTMNSKGGPNAGAMGMRMTIEDGKLSGKTWFDPQLGTAVETRMDQDMVMHISRAARTNLAGASPALQTMTNQTKQIVVIKLVELEAAAK